MSNVLPMFDKRESPLSFLEEAYQSLGYKEGTLLDAINYPDPLTEEGREWLEKGDWLALAYKAGAKKVFFVENDPVLVFSQFQHTPSDEQLLSMFRRTWCMARPQCLFIAVPGELRVYKLNRLPTQDVETLQKTSELAVVKKVSDVAVKLQEYNRERVESRQLFADERFGTLDQRADKRLIQDLKAVRQSLLEKGLESQYAHALIGRSIFIRYLEDRKVLLPEYFERVAHQNPIWQEILSREQEKPILSTNGESRRYYRVLQDKEFTYALFRQLSTNFNGDMFPDVDEEERRVDEVHLKIIRNLLLGDSDEKQPPLFFWAYDFEIIPIELISSIYEEFYHKSNVYHPNAKKQDDKGTHYTPSVLVEHVLSQVIGEEYLISDPKILDPACGSGIFLVEAFRRIVRFKIKMQNNAKEHKHTLTPDELREILRNQIRGIEINEDAVHIAAFSLYLALLHYQEPPDIMARRLPKLIYDQEYEEDEDHYHVLFRRNTFALIDAERAEIRQKLETLPRYQKRSEDTKLIDSAQDLPMDMHSVDIIVGNPPWGFEKGATQEIQDAQEQAKRWCERYEWSIGDDELSQAFIARSLSLLKLGGRCSLLVPTGIFLKHHRNSKEFRRRWLEETTIKTVVNFAHVRHAFFKANAPFAFVHFVVDVPRPENWVRYWSAKKTEVVDKTQSVILGQSDIKLVKQIDLKYNEYLWKVYWWGNHRDATFINNLRFNVNLEQLASEKGWPKPGRGFEIAGGHKPSTWLKNYKALPTKYFVRYGPIDTTSLESPPDFVYRHGSSDIQDGWRLLIGQGITQAERANGRVEARLEKLSYCFQSSIHGLNVEKAEDWERKVLVGIAWSSLARYYYFMTASSWATWHHQLHLEEAMSLPIRFPENNVLREEIVKIVDELLILPVIVWNSGEQSEKVTLLEQRLDKAIFDLYELSESERDLVLDICEFGLEFFYLHSKSKAMRSVGKQNDILGTANDLREEREQQYGLEGYIYAFLKMWNRELAPDGEFCWRIIRPSHIPMIVVVFSAQDKGDVPLSVETSDDEEWIDVLKQCSEALRQPVSRRIYTDMMIRVVTDTDIFIIKRDERRLWTRSMAYEDAEATLLQAMNLQETVQV